MSFKECESCKHFTIEKEENLENVFENCPIPVMVAGCDLDNLDELKDEEFGKFVKQQLTNESCIDYEVE